MLIIIGGLALDQYYDQKEPTESVSLSSLNIRQIAVGLWHSIIITNTGLVYAGM